MIGDHGTPPLADNQRFTLAALFIRAHQSSQAALILAERGMIGDARAVLRSAVEGVIAMYGLAATPTFIDRLRDDYRLNQQKLARVVLDEPSFRELYASAEIAQMEAINREVAELRANSDKDKRPRGIIWDQVAAMHCPDLYKLLYRPLSIDGTHTNLDAINRHVQVDPGGRVTGLKGGPDAEGIVEVLKAATLIVLWAADPISRAFPMDGIDDRIQAYLRRFRELPGSEA
jgi:hypothetical protein